MESVRLHIGSIIPVLLTVSIVLQAVTGQQCNCNNQKVQGNDKLNGFLLNKFNQLRDNPNLNAHGHNLQLNKQSMPSMGGSLSQSSNTQKNMQGEIQIPMSSFRITNGNSDSAQNGPSLNIGLPPNNSPSSNNGIAGLKINQFQFIPNTPCNQKPATPSFEAQMLPIPLSNSPTPSDTPCQNQGFQTATCAQNVPQSSGNGGSNFIVPHNSVSSETQPGQAQSQPQVVYVVLPPQPAPTPAPQYNPPMYYTPASSPSKSLSMKSLLPLLLEMLQEKNNCGCQNCPHCGSPVNQDPRFGSFGNQNLYGPTENNFNQVSTEQPKVKENISSEVIEPNKELAEKSAALTMPKEDSGEREAEKSSEYLENEFEEESLEDTSIEKE